MAANGSMGLTRKQLVVSALCKYFAIDPKKIPENIAGNEIGSSYLSLLKSAKKEDKVNDEEKVLACIEMGSLHPGNLLFYPVRHVIDLYQYEIWNEEVIEYALGFFTPDNMRMDVISKSSIMSEGDDTTDFKSGPFLHEEIMSLKGLELVKEHAEPIQNVPEPIQEAPPPVVQEKKHAEKKSVKPKWLKM